MTLKLESAGLNRHDKILKIANLNPTCCEESDTLLFVIEKILSSGYRRIPIVSRAKILVGIVTYMDILNAFLRGQELNEPISVIMTREVIFCEADDTIEFVLQKMKLSRKGGLPVVKGKKVVGIICERDIVKNFANVYFGKKIEEIMTKKPFFVSSNISILDCLKSMVNTRYRRLPIVKNGKLLGIVTAIDVLKYIKDHNFNTDALDEPLDFIMRKDVYTTSKEKDVSEAIKLMKSKDVGGILIVNDKNDLEGIITERDILEEIV